jgi:formylglycine-generating enzyme required for sulfatase activity
MYAGSDFANPVAWYAGNSGLVYHPVAGKDANACGLFDMSGNLWEWTSDWYGMYGSGSMVDPAGPGGGGYRVIRGGDFNSLSYEARVVNRNNRSETSAKTWLGFRLARTSL